MENKNKNIFAFLRQKKAEFFKKKFPETCSIQQDYIVIDFETTGFYANKGDKIIAVGGIKVKDCNIQRQDSFYELVNPEREIPEVVRKLTGIANEDVEDKETIDIVFPRFLEWAGEGIIAGHAVDFDISFVRKLELDPAGMKLFSRYFDTRELVSMIYPFLRNKNLFQIAEYLELNILVEHNALEDAVLAAEILKLCIEEFREKNINTPESINQLMKGRNMIISNNFNIY